MSTADLALLRGILADVSGRPADRITSKTSLSKLGLDSLDRVVLAVRFEETFGVCLPDEALAGLRLVADLEARAEVEVA